MNFKNKLWDNRIKGKAGRQETKEKKRGEEEGGRKKAGSNNGSGRDKRV